MAFQFQAPPDAYGKTIAELIQQRGQQLAQGQAASGTAWANGVQQVGQIAAAVPQQIQQQKSQQLDQQVKTAQLAQVQQGQSDLHALDTALSQPGGREAILNALPGHLRPTVTKQFEDQDRLHNEAIKAQDEANARITDAFANDAADIAAHGNTPEAAQTKISLLKQQYANDPATLQRLQQVEQQVQQNPTVDTVKAITDGLIASSPKRVELQQKADELKRQIDVSAETARHHQADEAQAATNAANRPAPQPTTASLAADAANPTSPTATQSAAALGKIHSAQASPAATPPSDVKEAIAGMRDGTIPPQLPGRASKDYTALMAEAHRQGYDLERAATDWVATQKHIATLNGSQQTRLNQSINALPDLLDSVDSLASQWKGGNFPLLNKANLALAKNGAYGDKAATIARQLDSQIADVTADLGSVYMGGNSPTDHALDLAGKSLSGDWSEQVLHDMVSLARKNVTIRKNSIANTGVQGASPDNPYAPKAVTAPATIGLPGVGDTFQGGKVLKVEKVK